MAAIQQICQEKNLSVESVIETIEAALAAAYRKDFGQKNQNIKVEYDAETGESRVFDVKTVVEDELKAKAEAEAAERAAALERGEELPEPVITETAGGVSVEGEEDAEPHYNPKLHISLSDAKEIKPDAAIDEEIRVELQVPDAYGRMAAQTAKQVIIQRLREAERATIFAEFQDKERTVQLGSVQRREGRVVLVDIHKATAILPPEEQVERERYGLGERLKVYVQSVGMGSRGPEIIVSRRSPEIVRELFTVEIPEIANGLIEIKAIARDAGWRSKVAVHTDDENIDPIGSCVGQRGSRVQTIISELAGEKIDIIQWAEDPQEFITNALLPAKVLSLEIHEEEKRAIALVEPDQLSLAIGKQGQNVRLASQLTGYKISIVEVQGSERREVTEEEMGDGAPASPSSLGGPGAPAEVVTPEAPAAEPAPETVTAEEPAETTEPEQPAAEPVAETPADKPAPAEGAE